MTKTQKAIIRDWVDDMLFELLEGKEVNPIIINNLTEDVIQEFEDAIVMCQPFENDGEAS